MVREMRTHIGGDAMVDPKLTPKHLTKQEFANRLYKLMLAKGWNQSELSRRANLPRDSISTYIRGKTLPTPVSLRRLADVLGITAEELLPNHVESAIDFDTPALEMRVSPNAPNTAWLRVNRAVSLKAALKIMELLEEDDAFDREGNGSAAPVQHNEN